MLRRFQPVQQPRKSLAKSQTHAERLRNLGQAFAIDTVRVTPGSPAFQLVQSFRPRFRNGLISELVPQIFNQLEAFKSFEVCTSSYTGIDRTDLATWLNGASNRGGSPPLNSGLFKAPSKERD